MKPSFLVPFLILIHLAAFPGHAEAQTLAPGGEKAGAQLEILTKKIEEQNLKIDALSQQILKLENKITNLRPGVMIGEAPVAAPRPPISPAPAAVGNAHVVTKGETLTSIAKAYKVGVADLQKFNHIENDRALQIGQTIMLPTAGGTSPAPAVSPSE